MASLKPFESTVIFREAGQEHNAVVLAVKPAAGSGLANSGVLIDLAFFKQLMSADGKTPLQVIGSSRQVEMVQFRHDVKPDQYELVEDWFFGLNDEQLEALIKERSRRKEEALQAAFAAAQQEREKELLDGVTVKPSAAVLELAAKLWTSELRKSQNLDEHTDIELPKYAANPKAWEPWIERAKQQLTPKPDQSSTSILDKPTQAPGAGTPGGEKDPTAGSNGGTVQ